MLEEYIGRQCLYNMIGTAGAPITLLGTIKQIRKSGEKTLAYFEEGSNSVDFNILKFKEESPISPEAEKEIT